MDRMSPLDATFLHVEDGVNHMHIASCATFAGPAPGRTPVPPVEPLTECEEEVLAAVARGLTNTEIGEQLYIGLSTVKTHLGSLMTKLGARNRVELVMWAYDTGRAGR